MVTFLLHQSPRALQLRDASGSLPVEVAAAGDAPLDVLFLLVTKWPECLPRRRSLAVEGRVAGDTPPNPWPQKRACLGN
jgi:hypothetical protein